MSESGYKKNGRNKKMKECANKKIMYMKRGRGNNRYKNER